MLDHKKVGACVRKFRKMAGLTQAELADAVGLSRPAITSLEAGRWPTRFETMCDLADVLLVPLDVLVGRAPPSGGPLVSHFVHDPEELRLLDLWRLFPPNEKIVFFRMMQAYLSKVENDDPPPGASEDHALGRPERRHQR